MKDCSVRLQVLQLSTRGCNTHGATMVDQGNNNNLISIANEIQQNCVGKTLKSI